MRTGFAIAIVLVLVLGSSACRSKPREAARIDGAIAAVVQEVDEDWLGISGSAPARWDPKHVRARHFEPDWNAHRCELVVTRPKAMTDDLMLPWRDCYDQRFELVADAEHTRLAVRSLHTGARYVVFYFGTEGRSFEPPPDFDRPPPLDWAAIPTLDAMLEPIFENPQNPLVVDEVRSRRGEAGLAEFVIKTALHYMQPMGDRTRLCTSYTPGWRAATATLPPEQARRVASALAAANIDVECFPGREPRTAGDAGPVERAR